MSIITDGAKDLYNLGKGTVGVATGVAGTLASRLAIPAMVLSTTHNGSYPERVLGGYYSLVDLLGKTVGAFAHNTGITTCLFDAGKELINLGTATVQNWGQDPEKLVYAAIATYLTGESIPIYKKLKDKYLIKKYKRLCKEHNLI